MWRSQVGCLEMFLAYFKANVEDVGKDLSYRDFLSDIISVHEEHMKSCAVRKRSVSPSSNSKFCERSSAIEELFDEATFCEEVKAEPEETASPLSRLEPSDGAWLEESKKEEEQDDTDFGGEAERGAFEAWIAAASVLNEAPLGIALGHEGHGSLEGELPAESELFADDRVALAEMNAAAQMICTSLQATEQQQQEDRSAQQQQQSFPCSFCGKVFTQRSSKVTHERLHTRSPAFSCSVCGKAFSRMSNKLRHEKIHRGERPYTCLYCGKAFLEKSGKKIHERIHTGERPYSCAVCGKTFIQQCHKALHERTHLQEKRHTCAVCGLTFAHKQSKILHERAHKAVGGNN